MPSWIQSYAAPIAAAAAVATFILTALHFLIAVPIHNRFDDLRADMYGRFDAVDQRFDAVDQRFEDFQENVNQRFDTVNQRLDQLIGVVSELSRFTVGIAERVSRHEGQIQAIQQQLQVEGAP